jgi:2-polyprenyl-3-methyl-5-hydroxy-6-metoxy-1,4-benzoquinol methylase
MNDTSSNPVAALRPRYQSDLADGVARFFEPRRTACPWCNSTRLHRLILTRDLYQHKPGEFSLDRCDDCRHVFQNPQLSAAGLAFYYRDFYDGLGEKQMAKLLASMPKTYRERARSLLAFTPAPERWLDVGTGHGHFCEAARAVFATTRFDGLDFTDGAQIAERAGRVQLGYSGSFVELAPTFEAQYDVVSMFHYLEHSTHPQQDIEAARVALRPGGHVLIEVPDPDSRFARLLGAWWGPWFQPQHLHFVPVANLRRKLSELGFTVVAEQHAEPHIPVDLLTAVWFAMNAVAPDADLPWLPAKSALRRGLNSVLRAAIVVVCLPALLLAALFDRILVKPLAGRSGWSNTYRLIARRD